VEAGSFHVMLLLRYLGVYAAQKEVVVELVCVMINT